MASNAPARPWHSLRLRLPLFIAAFVAAAVLGFLWLSYQQVEGGLVRAGQDRAVAAANELALLLGQSTQTRLAELRKVGRDPAVSSYLAAPGPAGADAARTVLAGAGAAGQPPVELWDGDGHLLLSARPSAPAPAGARTDFPPPSRPTGSGTAPLAAYKEGVYWQTTAEAPSTAPTAVSGYVVSRRFLTGSASGADALQRLVGEGAVIKIGSAGGGVWTDLSRIVPAPSVAVHPGIIADEPSAERRLLGGAAAVRGTPWTVLVEFPRAAIVAPARAFFLRMLGVAALLVVLAAIGAYFAGARLTRPLRQLAAASDALARGQQDVHIDVPRRDEVGQLASAFSLMVTELRTSRTELERRVDERTRDVTALNVELERRVGELKTLAAELEAFSYSVSHDLRAPVRHITGFAALLERAVGPELGEQAARYVRTISESANRMGRLIDDLLVFSRMGRAEMLRTRIVLDAMVADVRSELASGSPDRLIDWTIHPLPVIEGDPPMMRLVVVNLLSNAVKYTARRPRAAIEVGCRSAPDGVELFVRDNGVGFDMAYSAKLFGVFQRLHDAADFEGTGIGLANVRRIVERHGGRTRAEGAPDAGATFYVALPPERVLHEDAAVAGVA